MITSIHNPKVQWVRALQARARDRRAEQCFVMEGVRLVEEALVAGWDARLVFYTQDLSERGQQLIEGFAAQGAPVELVASQVLAAASDTHTPQGVLAVLPIRTLPLPEPLSFVLIADGVRDPGNLGTMLRTAAAAGVEAVFLPRGSVDPFAPKVVRAAMGAHFRLSVSNQSWEEIRAVLKNADLRVYLAAAGEGIRYTDADFRSRLALVVGGEAEGAGEAARALADAWVHIPMPGGAESLNAAVATAVLLFEVVRQRERGGENADGSDERIG